MSEDVNNQGAVGLYFHRLGNAGGGAERMICQLAGALAERGFCVYLITWDAAEAQAFYPLNPAVQWIKLGFQRGTFDKFRRIHALARILEENNVRALVGFVMSGDRTVYAAVKLAGVRLVVAERNAPSMYWLRYNLIQRWLSFGLLHLADYITVQMEGFIKGYPSSLRHRIKAIPNPVPVVLKKARPEIANHAGRFILLTVSRLDRVQKRMSRLIAAFSRISIKHPSWDLRIIGDGPEYAELLRLRNDLGLADRASLEPTTVEIFDIYAQSHLFAIPSLWEGFPNALAEAMSHGLPAVGFAQAAGVADLIGNGGGWLAAGLDDEVTLAATLDEAMTNGEERARRGIVAAQNMAAFAPSMQFDRWAALLTPLMTVENGH